MMIFQVMFFWQVVVVVDICVVIVIYVFDLDLLVCVVVVVCDQVGYVVVFDNGSLVVDVVVWLYIFVGEGVSVIVLLVNVGFGVVFNCVCEQVCWIGVGYVMLMDQDSVLEVGMVQIFVMVLVVL